MTNFKFVFNFDKTNLSLCELEGLFFNTAIENIQFFKKRSANENIEKTYEHMLNELISIKDTASYEEKNDLFTLSFLVKNDSEKFNEISSDGRRLWLRQHIEDICLRYVFGGLISKQMDYVREHKEDVPDSNKAKTFEKALNKAMKDAYNKVGDYCWIEGE